VPHTVPGALSTESTQADAPVEHEVTPVLHWLGFVVQLTPAVQPTHWFIALQTWLVPHEVPAPFGVPSTHVVVPVEHDVVPLKHEGVGFE
jgi:hypothetical protein